ncbi:MAG TPA: YgiT-type zinc finger protein [Candidatus Nanoarchaeia archaeon]|nr:YgiT-type zinc finger protein [Candidatus Nanoarchaeia archaeon]
MAKKCDECGARTVRKLVDFSMYGIHLGKFPAEVCTKCGEEVFDEKTSEEIDSVAKKKGLWGLARKVKVVKIGNSLAVRIPKAISDFAGLREGKEALMKPEKNRIVIEG